MTIDTYAIRDRVTARTFGWQQTAAAPEPVRLAAAEYQQAVTALDDALVDYELEVAQRRAALKDHEEAVTAAFRDGKKLPAAKVPSLEEIEVRHGAIISARETFVHEAATTADRVAQAHYPQWRADVLEQLQAAAAAVAQVTSAARQSIEDWNNAAQILGRLDRHWAPRTAKLDGATAMRQVESWRHQVSIETTQMARNVGLATEKIQQFTEDPVVAEFDPTAGEEQYSAAYLAQQTPTTRAVLQKQADAS